MRKYDLEEIDRMRAAARALIDVRSYRAVSSDRDDAKTAEDHLRTYMLNGTGPEELEQYAKLLSERRNLEVRIKDAETLMKQQSCQHAWKINSLAVDDKAWRDCPKCGKTERVAAPK